MRLSIVLAAICLACIARADGNLPLGLPADRILPVELDGYKLVSLDRTKELILKFDARRLVKDGNQFKVTVDVPLFIYMPEKDRNAEMRAGLAAVHAELARLIGEKEQIDPQRLMTLYLALDNLVKEVPPVVVKQPVSANPDKAKSAATDTTAVTEQLPVSDNPIEAALHRNG